MTDWTDIKVGDRISAVFQTDIVEMMVMAIHRTTNSYPGASQTVTNLDGRQVNINEADGWKLTVL